MASSESHPKLNPTVEIMNIQRSKISECIRSINDNISVTLQNCTYINDMLHQLEQLCQLHFMYEIQLLEEMNYPSVAEQKRLLDSFLQAIVTLKAADQCHTPAFFNDFNQLRLDFVFNMNNETRMLCDFIRNNYRGTTGVVSR